MIKKNIVWKISGDINNDDLITLVSNLKHYKEIGYNVCLLFGAGASINKELTGKINYFKGQRITTDEVLPIIKNVVKTQMNNIVSIDKNVLIPVYEEIFTGKKLEDYGCVCNPTYANCRRIYNIWSEEKIPVIHFLTRLDDTRDIWNANADLCLRQLCISLNADVMGYSVGSTKDTDKFKVKNIPLDEMNNFDFDIFSDGFKLKLVEINLAFKNNPKLQQVFIGCSLPTNFSSKDYEGIIIRRNKKYTIGVIGSRGFIGNEIVKYIQSNPNFICINILNFDDVYKVYIDILISCCPNNVLKDYLLTHVALVPILDISSDFRHQEGWIYSYCFAENIIHNGLRKMSNAGCYSTASISAIYPLKDLVNEVYITGISSYSGAGKDFKKKFPNLIDTVLPYQPLQHIQQNEMSEYLKLPIHFVPIVSDQFDRGMVCSIQLKGKKNWDIDEVKSIYNKAYEKNKFIQFIPNESIAPNLVANTTNIVISNLSIHNDVLHIQSTIDNILIGGGYSAYIVICKYFGVDIYNNFKNINLIPSHNIISLEAYNSYLNKLDFPLGFKGYYTNVSFTPNHLNRKKVLQFTTISMPFSCKWKAVYTKNKICGHPVNIGRKRLLNGKGIKAIWINNKISNVGCEGGEEDAEEICKVLSNKMNCDYDEILPLSTGIIGWKLPKNDIIENINNSNYDKTYSIKDIATSIMTTDKYPKASSVILSNGGIITAIAKGAGMIEPNMGTMLCVIMTDVLLSEEFIDKVLKNVVNKTFNNISIDADTSTSDAVILVSTGLKSGVDEKEFEENLLNICNTLSYQIVRNGEGVRHIIEVQVIGANDEDTARRIGKNIVNSLLVKTAIAGNDANIGRIIGAMGRNIDNVNWDKVDVCIGDEIIYENGKIINWNIDIEKKLSSYIKNSEIYLNDEKKPNYPVNDNSVLIKINLHNGYINLTVIGSDLTEDYVLINADYRS